MSIYREIGWKIVTLYPAQFLWLICYFLVLSHDIGGWCKFFNLWLKFTFMLNRNISFSVKEVCPLLLKLFTCDVLILSNENGGYVVWLKLIFGFYIGTYFSSKEKEVVVLHNVAVRNLWKKYFGAFCVELNLSERIAQDPWSVAR
jgi:hypothetical protein